MVKHLNRGRFLLIGLLVTGTGLWVAAQDPPATSQPARATSRPAASAATRPASPATTQPRRPPRPMTQAELLDRIQKEEPQIYNELLAMRQSQPKEFQDRLAEIERVFRTLDGLPTEDLRKAYKQAPDRQRHRRPAGQAVSRQHRRGAEDHASRAAPQGHRPAVRQPAEALRVPSPGGLRAGRSASRGSRPAPGEPRADHPQQRAEPAGRQPAPARPAAPGADDDGGPAPRGLRRTTARARRGTTAPASARLKPPRPSHGRPMSGQAGRSPGAFAS